MIRVLVRILNAGFSALFLIIAIVFFGLIIKNLGASLNEYEDLLSGAAIVIISSSACFISYRNYVHATSHLGMKSSAVVANIAIIAVISLISVYELSSGIGDWVFWMPLAAPFVFTLLFGHFRTSTIE